MGRIFAIARLTRKAAFRFRLVPVMALLLIVMVLLLPAVIKHDGTARGMAQIVLSYTLTLTTALLGLMNLWFGTGTLAKDIEDATIQLIDVKPIPRWQVWIGKWIGVLEVNLGLLLLAGAVICAQLMLRGSKLPHEERQILQQEVFVARGSLKPPVPKLDEKVEEIYRQRLKESPELASQLDAKELKRLIRQQLQAAYEIVPPGYSRTWVIDTKRVYQKVRNNPLYLRVKFHAAQRSERETFLVEWRVGSPAGPTVYREVRSQAPDSFQEFQVPPGLVGEDGQLTIEATNLNEIALVFPLEEGIEVLYKEGGFLMNYIRGLFIVFCWLALIAAVGLACASYMSFSTATFVSISLLLIAFSTGTIQYIIETGSIIGVNPETGRVDNPTIIDKAIVAFFKLILFIINMVRGFSPIDQLSTGRLISWATVMRALLQIVVVLGGLFTFIGIIGLNRRELATAQR